MLAQADHDERGDDTDFLLSDRPDDRRLVRPSQFGRRVLTAPLRSYPDFIVIGAMKSGTSSLFSYLCQHPGITPPWRKETHFFTKGLRAGRSVDWYRAHFPLSARKGGGLTGEATPDYVFEEHVPVVLKRTVPSVKLVLVLRDPVERAISQYFHEVRMKREGRDIEEAIALEDRRLLAAARTGPAGLETALHASYKRRGHYAEQIARYRQVFPPEQLLILGSGTVFSDTEAALADVSRFLGIAPPPDDIDLSVRNPGSNRTEVPDALRTALQDHFAPHNERLWAVLGRKLDW